MWARRKIENLLFSVQSAHIFGPSINFRSKPEVIVKKTWLIIYKLTALPVQYFNVMLQAGRNFRFFLHFGQFPYKAWNIFSEHFYYPIPKGFWKALLTTRNNLIYLYIYISATSVAFTLNLEPIGTSITLHINGRTCLLIRRNLLFQIIAIINNLTGTRSSPRL